VGCWEGRVGLLEVRCCLDLRVGCALKQRKGETEDGLRSGIETMMNRDLQYQKRWIGSGTEDQRIKE
jgi:hypothetical protein